MLVILPVNRFLDGLVEKMDEKFGVLKRVMGQYGAVFGSIDSNSFNKLFTLNAVAELSPLGDTFDTLGSLPYYPPAFSRTAAESDQLGLESRFDIATQVAKRGLLYDKRLVGIKDLWGRGSAW